MLEQQLHSYSPELTSKPRLVVGTKMDLAGSEDRLRALVSALLDQPCLGIAAVTGHGVSELKARLEAMLGTAEPLS